MGQVCMLVGGLTPEPALDLSLCRLFNRERISPCEVEPHNCAGRPNDVALVIRANRTG